VPEREQRLDVPLVEPPISHVDALFVRDVQFFAGIVPVGGRNRTTAWGTSRQLAGGVLRAEENIAGWRAPLPGLVHASTTAGPGRSTWSWSPAFPRQSLRWCSCWPRRRPRSLVLTGGRSMTGRRNFRLELRGVAHHDDGGVGFPAEITASARKLGARLRRFLARVVALHGGPQRVAHPRPRSGASLMPSSAVTAYFGRTMSFHRRPFWHRGAGPITATEPIFGAPKGSAPPSFFK